MLPRQDPARCPPPWQLQAGMGSVLGPSGAAPGSAGVGAGQVLQGCQGRHHHGVAASPTRLGIKGAVQELGGLRWDQWSQCSSWRVYLAFWIWFYLPA